jgi:RND family efflux transporter MFP subunit
MSKDKELLHQLRINRAAETESTSRWPLITAGIVVGLAALGGGAWLLLRNEALAVTTAPVIATAAANGNTTVLDASGYVVARRIATVSSKVSGRVLEVLIEEGQTVEANQVLARLDPIDAQAQRELAEVQLAVSRSQIESTRAQLVEADANARRMTEMDKRSLVPKNQLDQAVATRDSLRAQLKTAERTAEAAASSVRIAELGLENMVVRAPFAGVVTAKAAQPGEIVSPLSAGGGFTRTGIGTIVDMDSLEVEVDVGEAFIGRVQARMPVEATLNAYPEWKIPAEVIAIIPAADRGKATVRVRIALKLRDPRIVPDMGVRVSFLESSRPAAAEAAPAKPTVRVPADAIVERGGVQIAFVVDKAGSKDATVAQRTVTPGRTLGSDREITAGLARGETVVVAPPKNLADGMRVREAKPESE